MSLETRPEILQKTRHATAYYDQRREQQERNSLYKRLYDLMERLKSISLKPWMNPAEIFKETVKRDARFIEWKVVDGRFEVALKKNAVSKAIRRSPRQTY